MKTLVLFAFLLMLSSNISAQNSQPTITTMQIEASNVEPMDIIAFNNALSSALEKVEGYSVISSDELASLMEQEDVVLECNEPSCYAKAASALNVDFVLSASLFGTQQEHSVEIFVVNVATARKASSMRTTFGGNVNDFLGNLSFLARNAVTEALTSYVPLNKEKPVKSEPVLEEVVEDTVKEASVDTVATEDVALIEESEESFQQQDSLDYTEEVEEVAYEDSVKFDELSYDEDVVDSPKEDQEKKFRYHMGLYGHITGHYRGPSPGLGANFGVSDLENNQHYVGVSIEAGYTPVLFYYDENWSIGVGVEYYYRLLEFGKWSFKPGATIGYWYMENRYYTVEKDYFDLTKYNMFGGPAFQTDMFLNNGHNLFSDVALIMGAKQVQEVEGEESPSFGERFWSMIRMRVGFNFNI